MRLLAAVFFVAACGGSTTTAPDARRADAGAVDGAAACLPCPTNDFCYQVLAGKAAPPGSIVDAGPTQRGCNPIPAACEPTPTCDCVATHVVGCPSATCEALDGGLVVTCALP